MKTNANIFVIIGIFLSVVTAAYTVWSLISEGQVEWAGTVFLGLATVMTVFLAFFMNRVHAAQAGELAEDRPDAEIDDGDPEVGFFNPYSWWPIVLAAGCTLCFLGLAVGFWICFIGGASVTIALVGWVFENYRGQYQH